MSAQPAGSSGDRSRRGPKPSLSQAVIVDAALRLLDAEDGQPLSLRRVAAELRVNAMTIYGYFDSKDSLIDAVIASLLPVPSAIGPAKPWHECLLDSVRAIHDAMVRRPGVAEVLATRTLSGPGMDHLREHFLRLLRDGGLSPEQTVDALGAITRYLIGSVIIESDRRRPSGQAESARLRDLDRDDYPVLVGLADQYADRAATRSWELGLALLLTGLRALGETPPYEHNDAEGEYRTGGGTA